MHAATHSLAHRAPPATRTRARWQPYNSLPLSSCSMSSARSPNAAYLNTPSSSISSPVASSTPSCDSNRPRQDLPTNSMQTPKECQVRDAFKSKHALGLVDQAVKVLCEIWRPQDIPTVFLTASKPIALLGSTSKQPELLSQHDSRINRNTQLPSPVSPNTQPFPVHSHTTQSPSQLTAPNKESSQSEPEAVDSKNNLLPIRGFVHEVLRRSRTTGHILQTALCYLEAVRPKIPHLLEKDKLKTLQSEDSARIGDADPDQLIVDGVIYSTQDTISADQKSSIPASTSPTSSPLLCPRRAFLASLILASKFMQDKCYSNRAWAKLAGLPTREIGLCERALGEALEWRLWVGKAPTATTASPPLAQRPFVRSQSEASVFAASSQIKPLSSGEITNSCTLEPFQETGTAHRILRRSATLPADLFSGPGSCRELNISDYETRPLSFIPQETDMFTAKTTDSRGIQTLFEVAPNLSQEETTNNSPVPDTPGLSSSPSSTDSTSPDGDSTIQMAEFLEEGMVNFHATDPFFSTQAWLDSVDCARYPSIIGNLPFAGDNKANLAFTPQILDTIQYRTSFSGLNLENQQLGPVLRVH